MYHHILNFGAFYVLLLQDIRLSGDTKKIETIPAWKSVNEEHIANRFHYSLRVSLWWKNFQVNKTIKKQVFNCSFFVISGLLVHLVLADTREF